MFSKSKWAKYEEYREAWQLLREAAELVEEAEGGAEECAAPALRSFPTNAVERMEAVANFVRKQMEGRTVHPSKAGEEV
jgi:hypothetical protein